MKKFFGLILLGSLFSTWCIAKEPDFSSPISLTWNVNEKLPQVYTIEKDFYDKVGIIACTAACLAIGLYSFLGVYAEYRAFKDGNKKAQSDSEFFYRNAFMYWLMCS